MLVGRSWSLVLILGLWFAALRVRPSIPRGMAPWVLFAALLFSLNGWALMSAFDRMSVSLSILIFYLFPFMVGLLAAALRIESLRPAMLIGLVVAFVGLFLALDTEGELDLLGVVLAVVSALAISGNILISGKLFRHGMSPVSLALWVMIGASVLFAGSLTASGGFQWPNSGTGWWAFSGSVFFVGVAFVRLLHRARFLARIAHRADHEPGADRHHRHGRRPVRRTLRPDPVGGRGPGRAGDPRRDAGRPKGLTGGPSDPPRNSSESQAVPQEFDLLYAVFVHRFLKEVRRPKSWKT